MKTFTPNAYQRKLEKAAVLMYKNTEDARFLGGLLVRACLYSSETAEPVIELIPGTAHEIGRFLGNHMDMYPIIHISFLDNEAICELRSGNLATYGREDDMLQLRGYFAYFSTAKDNSYMLTYQYDTIPQRLTSYLDGIDRKSGILPGKLYDLAAEFKSA